MDTPSPANSRSLLETFEAVFDRDIAPRLEARDHERIALASRKFRNWCLIIGAGAAAAVIMHLLTRDSDSLFMGLAAGAGAYWLLIGRPTKRLTDSIKQEIFNPLCDALGFTYNLRPDGSNIGYFTELSLVDSFSQSQFEDEVSGRHHDLKFSLVEAHLKQRQNKSTRTVFRGLLAAFEMTKDFQGRTLILRDGGVVGNFLGGIGKGLERVRLEDPRFESTYEVYGSDQIEARYLLTPAFMDRLLTLERQLGSKVRLAFDRNMLLMSIELDRDAFDVGKLDRPLSDKGRLLGIVKDLTMIFDVVETLRLNAETKL